MLKTWLQRLGPNPLDRIIQKAYKRGHKTFLIYWNRGLGDIPLGLYAIVYRIRASIPDAHITFLTRPNLRDGFVLMGGVDIVIAPNLKRGEQIAIGQLIDTTPFDVVIEKADPTQWVKWQLNTLTPVLHWQSCWDDLCQKYDLDPKGRYVGAHVQTETHYATWRDWPLASWRSLVTQCAAAGLTVLLFGFAKEPPFAMDRVIDLRGHTSLFDLLSIIKNRCEAIVVPDSGISSMVYFLKETFRLRQITLWAESGMGILKQNVPSPNPLLEHIPLMGHNRDISTISPQEVYGHLQKGRHCR